MKEDKVRYKRYRKGQGTFSIKNIQSNWAETKEDMWTLMPLIVYRKIYTKDNHYQYKHWVQKQIVLVVPGKAKLDCDQSPPAQALFGCGATSAELSGHKFSAPPSSPPNKFFWLFCRFRSTGPAGCSCWPAGCSGTSTAGFCGVCTASSTMRGRLSTGAGWQARHVAVYLSAPPISSTWKQYNCNYRTSLAG